LLCPSVLEKGKTISERIELTVENIIATFFALWWAIGAGVVTFQGPHLVCGNGYLASWVALLASLYLLNATFHGAPQELLARRTAWAMNAGASVASKRYLLYLCACALVMLFSAFHVVFGQTAAERASLEGDGKLGAAIWSLMVSFVTLRDVVVLLAMRSADVSRKITAALLVVLWLLTAIATTIEGPFEAAGNGYFAAWMGLAFAFLLALEEFERTLSASGHFNAALLFSFAATVLLADAAKYLARTDVALYCPGSKGLVVLCPANYKGNEATPGFLCSAKPDAPLLEIPEPRFCQKALANFGFAYGITAMPLGALLVAALLSKSGALAVGGRLAIALGKINACLGAEGRLFGLPLTGLRLVAGLLLAYALGAALTLTYNFPPYGDIDNGFIASWLSVIGAAMLFRDEPAITTARPTVGVASEISSVDAPLPGSGASDEERADSAAGGGSSAPTDAPAPPTKPPYAWCLGLFALLLLIAVFDRMDDSIAAGLGGESVYGIFCGCLSFAMLLARLALIAKPKPNERTAVTIRLVLAAGVALCWLAAALVLTFVGPFQDVGNGYLAVWAGLVCALCLAFEEKQTRDLTGASVDPQ